MAVRNIVFDIGGVLKSWDPDLVRYFGETDGTAALAAILDSGLWTEMDRGVLEENEILRRMIALAPQQKRVICWFWDHLADLSVKYDYAVPWVRRLKDAGYHVYYLSNFSRRMRSQAPGCLGFLPLMDGGVFSCDVQMMKPDAAIYTYFLRKYDLRPEECLFIDDRQDNVDGAIAAGMYSIRFEGYAQSEPRIRDFLAKSQIPENTQHLSRWRKRYSFEEGETAIPENGSPTDDQPRKEKRILAYGDSNTYGWDPRDLFGEPYTYPWPSVLAKELGCAVINCGEPGREIPVTDRQLAWLESDLERNAPLDLLIIMLGTNDLLNSPGPDAGEIAVKMERTLRFLTGKDGNQNQGSQTRILLVCPPRLRTDEPVHQQVSRELAVEYKILADRYGIAFADASALTLSLAFDGVHLTENGHRQLAEWLARTINHM